MGVRAAHDPTLAVALLTNRMTYLAVLRDGLAILQDPYRRDQGRRPSFPKAEQRWARERAWVLSEMDDGPFNFETCCLVLGVNPSALRMRLRQRGLLDDRPPCAVRRAA